MKMASKATKLLKCGGLIKTSLNTNGYILQSSHNSTTLLEQNLFLLLCLYHEHTMASIYFTYIILTWATIGHMGFILSQYSKVVLIK